MKKHKGKAVVLLSGGIDSATTLAIAKKSGFDVYALSFRYGQRHKIELKAARNISEQIGVREHLILDVNLRKIGGSALTDHIPVPKQRCFGEMKKEIPMTYVPARNSVFLSIALAWAEVLQTGDIFIGVNVLDYSGYPDCRPAFITAFEKMANLATRAAVEGKYKIKIHTPLMKMGKSEIIQKGVELGVNYGLTHSCYDPDKSGKACGMCDACLLRLKGFQQLGMKDPVKYKKQGFF